MAATRRFASDHSLGPRDEARLCIIVEELVTNLIEHGGLEQPIGIELAHTGAAVRVALEDCGLPFDPRTPTDSDNVPSRGGGAGLRLVRAWSEIVGYEAAGGRNRLELSVPLSSD